MDFDKKWWTESIKNYSFNIYFEVINKSSQENSWENKMENSNNILVMFQKIADEEGKTLEEVVERAENMLRLIDQPLNEEGRLDYVERLLREKRIGPSQADMIIRKNHIFHDEIREIAEDSKKVLYNEFGIQIPDYTLVFDPAGCPTF